jgi:hypothetical protein
MSAENDMDKIGQALNSRSAVLLATTMLLASTVIATHRALSQDARSVERLSAPAPSHRGPVLGGLHHQYRRI